VFLACIAAQQIANYENRCKMIRRTFLLISAIYFAALGVLAIIVHQASPGPALQEILGIGIGDSQSEGGIVYLSGRRLSCTPIEHPGQFAVTCQIELAGQSLEIQARRNSPSAADQLGGTCQAIYDGRQWPCAIGSRHVHVHGYAYVPSSLGLSASQLAALRRVYPVENLPEETFLIGAVVVPVVTATMVVLVLVAWQWSQAKSKVRWTLVTFASAMFSLTGTFLVWVLLTSNFLGLGTLAHSTSISLPNQSLTRIAAY
jgi:hypothetical protein